MNTCKPRHNVHFVLLAITLFCFQNNIFKYSQVHVCALCMCVCTDTMLGNQY